MDRSWLDENVASPLTAVAHMQLEYIVLRALPCLAHGCFASHLSVRARQSWRGFACVLAITCGMSPSLMAKVSSDALALSYYLIVAAVVYRLQPIVAAGSLRADALFCLLFALLVFIPASLFRLISAVPMLVFGWHMVLGAHSYCLDKTRARQTTSLRCCLFFLLVDPNVVFLERATPESTSESGALHAPLKRILPGLMLMIAGRYGLAVLLPLAQEAQHSATSYLRYAGVMVTTLPAFLMLYWVRSGFAGVQIGLLQLLGYQVGECFDRPYLARSPVDFWRRWNVYVGHWARRYVFTPLSLALLRRQTKLAGGRWHLSSSKAGAVLLTFVCIGLLHDALNFAGEQTTHFAFLSVFSFAAIALLTWEGIEAAVAAHHTTASQGLWFRGTSRLYLAHYLVGLFALSGAIS